MVYIYRPVLPSCLTKTNPKPNTSRAIWCQRLKTDKIGGKLSVFILFCKQMKKSLVKSASSEAATGGIPKHFAIFTGKHLCWSCNFIKKRLQDRCFPRNVARFLITPILKNICERLLLTFYRMYLILFILEILKFIYIANFSWHSLLPFSDPNILSSHNIYSVGQI